jgi:shikimate kinase
VVARAGKSVTDIFTEHGEATFREWERAAVATGLTEHDGVLALGGGAVLSESTRTLLVGHRVVFLEVGMAAGMRRTGLSTARPLLVGLNPRATFKALLDARLPLYRQVATEEIGTDGLTPVDVVDEIVRRLDRRDR